MTCRRGCAVGWRVRPQGARIVGRLRWWSAKLFVAILWLAVLVMMTGTAVLAGRTGGGAVVVLPCSVVGSGLALMAALSMLLEELEKGNGRAQLGAALRRAPEV